MRLSPDQEEAVRLADEWLGPVSCPELLYNQLGNPYTIGLSHDYPVFSLGGYAGTGKTTVLRTLAERYPAAVLVTPTHKAAQVLRSKLPGYMTTRVRTFHSLIYTPDPEFTCSTTGSEMLPLETDGDKVVKLSPCDYHVKYHGAKDDSKCEPKEHLRFVKQAYLRGHHTLIIVDEASMLTEYEVQDIRSFGVPVMLVGDHGQLPPVKAKMNPWISSPVFSLTVNHRQGESSGIPEAADDARNNGKLGRESYGDAVRVLQAGSGDAARLLERFQPDARESTFLVQYNRTRAMLNQYFRRGQSATVAEGERIISLERQEYTQVADDQGNVTGETLIFSGMLATVCQVLDETPRTVVLLAELDADIFGQGGTKVILRVASKQLGSAEQLSYRDKPGGTSLWDYAYALTAHKAQGSEFNKVIVWQETPGDRRWLYTACTRSRQGLVVLVL